MYAFLREGRGEGLPGYGAFTAWCRARDVPFGGVGGRWIGNTYLDDSGRDGPASLNSTGDM